MEPSLKEGLSLAECVVGYDRYAQEVRGLAASTREMHRRLLRRFCNFRFGEEPVLWDAVCFTDIVRFLTTEFERFPNRGTQRTSLTSMRTLLRYLAEKSMVPKGWDEALPRTTTRRHAHLPRQVSREQVSARRDRALLLLFLRLGLRCEEVAHLKWRDIDWQGGSIRIFSQKSRRERILPLPQDVGKALAAYLHTFQTMPVWIFDSSRATFPIEMRRLHVKAITYVAFTVMLRSGCEGASSLGLRILNST
jgi:integrase/recombinase XerD